MGRSIADIKKERGIGGPPLLHGSDVPRKFNSVKVKCSVLRESPKNFGSPAIMEFDKPVFDCEAMSINMTNLRSLAVASGAKKPDEADFDKVAAWCAGKDFTFFVGMVNNPKTNSMTRSLFLDETEE